MHTLIASGLTKRFQTRCAVDRVDLSLDGGEVMGLVGLNGAGKTTLLRLLLGLVRPDGGAIELFGRRFVQGDRVVLDGVAGFVDDPAFYPHLSARVNLELLANLDGGGAAEAIDDALAQVELSDRASERISAYSYGMRQRLGIAAALMRRPRLLLLDEPTAGVDPRGVRFVSQLIAELSQKGIAVLLSSHQVGEIERICDSFTVLKRGRVVWQGTAQKMQASAPASTYRLSTSDDAGALALAPDHPGVRLERNALGELELSADAAALDRYMHAVARADIAVRSLASHMNPLERMFFELTSEEGHGDGGRHDGEQASHANP